MCNSPLVSQSSCELDIYLPSGFDYEDTMFQSAEMLIRSINFDTTLSAHRLESDLFDPISDDEEASSVLTEDETSSIDNTNFDMEAYFHEQSTVIPHIPNSSHKSKMDVHFPLSPASNSNQIFAKKFFIFDGTLGRERRPLLHEFIRLIVENDEYSHIAEYTDRKQGIFRLHKPRDMAELWKHVKGRNSDNQMTYDKLARAIRYYYKSGIMHSSPGRFTFRFGLKSGFGTTWWPAFQ